MTSSGSRQDRDTWDLASSVGVTATMVAVARAIATHAENPLINDPFAAPLVRAVGVDLLTRLASGETTVADLDDDPQRPFDGMADIADNMAVRTRFFDEFFLDAARAGIRQAVILASGLDSRAYRLPWPHGTVVYEVDQPQVIEFKSTTLAELGAQASADRRTVAVDLRDDWPAALCEAGFDRSQASAWSAEGLLGYLPPEAQDRLLDNITGLSATGSRLAIESMRSVESMSSPDHVGEDRLRERMQMNSERWRAHGFDVDMSSLIYLGARNEVSPYLTNRGWLMDTIPLPELRAASGLQPAVDQSLPAVEMLYISGTLYARH